jgi:hypothetical protein
MDITALSAALGSANALLNIAGSIKDTAISQKVVAAVIELQSTSVITPKPARHDHLKTGQA